MGRGMLEEHNFLGSNALNYVPIRTTFEECLQRNIRGVLCLDFALGYHGLSTFNYHNFPIYFAPYAGTTGRYIDSNISYQFVPQVDYKHTHEIKMGIYVTDPERTICDMIKYNRHEYHLLEALDEIYQNGFNINKELLEKLVNVYGIRERFEELKEDSRFIWDE